MTDFQGELPTLTYAMVGKEDDKNGGLREVAKVDKGSIHAKSVQFLCANIIEINLSKCQMMERANIAGNHKHQDWRDPRNEETDLLSPNASDLPLDTLHHEALQLGIF